jgi:hypothetical protein
MRAVYSPEHLRHEPRHEMADGQAIGIYEVPERAEKIRRSLEADGGFAFAAPTEHGADPITAIHEPAMLAYLEGAWREVGAGETAAEIFPDTFPLPALREGMGGGRMPRTPRATIGTWCFDTATPMVEGTYPAARDAVDVALTAMDLVLGGERSAYGLCRPPGHHAARAIFGGTASSTTRRSSPRSSCGAPASRSRSWTSTTTTGTARSRSSMRAATSCTFRSTATRTARTRTSPGSPRRPAPAPGGGRP